MNGVVLKHQRRCREKNMNESLPLTESVQYNRLCALNSKKEENIQSSFGLIVLDMSGSRQVQKLLLGSREKTQEKTRGKTLVSKVKLYKSG